MRNKTLIIISSILIIFSLFFSIKIIDSLFIETSNNVVNINDILETTSNNFYTSFDKTKILAKQYNLDVTILDNYENILFTTNNDISQTINEAIKHHDTILDIKINNIIKGKLIINNNYIELLNNKKINLYIVLTICFLLIFIMCILYQSHLNRCIISPFNKLKNFAIRIANGNLDIPLNMDRNNLFGAFTESFDIMRDELRISKENERKANESKKELVASLSHDIKTPVASIKAASQLLQVYITDDKITDKVKKIESKADQIELLINNLFHATLEELEELKVNPCDENSSIISDLISNADINNLVSDFNIPELIIKCDKLRLGQVIDNIISNSYKYANTKIDISTEINNNYLEISFSDYGKGINEDELPLLCQKFYRGNNSNNITGTGLGLYISKYFMTKMDGDLSINNIIVDNEIAGFMVTIKIYTF